MKRILLPLILLTVSLTAVAKQAGDWLTNYYKSPNPQDFVVEVRKLGNAGILANPKHKEYVAVFLSRILAANPEKIIEWVESLKSLNEAEREPLIIALWLADTKESKAYLTSINALEVLSKKPTNYLEIEILKGETLDALWAYFFATGADEPIRKIVSALNYAEYAGSVDAYKNSKKTEADQQRAWFDALFQSARWSLESNVRKEPKVAEICGRLIKEPSLSKHERLWLSLILSKALPDKYKMMKQESGEWRLEIYK